MNTDVIVAIVSTAGVVIGAVLVYLRHVSADRQGRASTESATQADVTRAYMESTLREVESLRNQATQLAAENARLDGELRALRATLDAERARSEGVVAEMHAVLSQLSPVVTDLHAMVAGNREIATSIGQTVDHVVQFGADHAVILQRHEAQARAWTVLFEHLGLELPDGLEAS